MGIAVTDEAWIKEYKQELNESESHAEAAEGWGVGFDGSFLFHIEADDRLPEDHYYYIDLEDGECLEARKVEDPEDVEAGFVYRGEYADWIDLIEGDTGAIDGMMSGVFELEGDMQKVLQYSQAAVELTATAEDIDTDYPY